MLSTTRSSPLIAAVTASASSQQVCAHERRWGGARGRGRGVERMNGQSEGGWGGVRGCRKGSKNWEQKLRPTAQVSGDVLGAIPVLRVRNPPRPCFAAAASHVRASRRNKRRYVACSREPPQTAVRRMSYPHPCLPERRTGRHGGAVGGVREERWDIRSSGVGCFRTGFHPAKLSLVYPA